MNKVQHAIETLLKGLPIIVADDESRENEGDLVALGETISYETLNFMSKHGKGLICTPISKEIAELHNLYLLNDEHSDGTKFTISIDHPTNTTGISIQERLDTIKGLLSSHKVPFKKPGHMFPLISSSTGVFGRRGHTEIAIELAHLAKVKPVGVICEILKEDGSMARRDDLIKMSEKWNIPYLTIDDIVEYKKRTFCNFIKTEPINLPTEYGEFKFTTYRSKETGELFSVLYKNPPHIPLVRIHSVCQTGDVFGSLRCDCGPQLEKAQELIAKEGGIIIYTPDEGRGIGLEDKIKAYKLQEEGVDTVEANKLLGHNIDYREYYLPAAILRDFNINSIKLLTNNPEKINDLKKYGINVERVMLWTNKNEHNRKYIRTKIEKMNHID